MNRPALVMVTLLVAGLACGCARRPATTASAAPSPTGATTGSPMTASTATTPGGRGGATAPASRAAGAPTPSTARPAPSEFQPMAELRDVHFDFDRYAIRPDGAQILDRNAAWLKANASNLLLIEGHCDERGTDEYNLALGERRAQATLNYLVAQGVSARRITIVSYGEERPQCPEHTEDCWAKNRRAHFLVKRQ